MTPPTTASAAVRRALRPLGLALLAPLFVLGITGLALAVRYAPDPLAGPLELARLQSSPAWSLLRSLHAWSAYVTLAVAALHTGRVLYERAWQGARRTRYVLGAGLVVLLILGHLSGFALRWDASGRRLAVALLHALRPFGGAARLLGLPDPAEYDAGLLERIYLIHTVLLGLALAALIAVHLAALRPDARPWTGFRLREGLLAALVLFVATFALAASLPPPLETGNEDAPWPFAIWAWIADAAGTVFAPLAVGLVALALLAAQPWLDRWSHAQRATQIALALIVLASFAWTG